MPFLKRSGLELSVVVVVHNMAREAPRTLYSLSAAYQRHISAKDYEVIVIDNGSIPPLDERVVAKLPGNFRLIRIDSAPTSPAHAINRGLVQARGDVIGVMIDGARLVTPGFLHFARSGARLYPHAVVAGLGWYLGFDHQRWAIEGHYNQSREDVLLASIDWCKDGYRLFEISALDESSVDGWFGPIAESNTLFLPRDSWQQLGGVDERFDAPGGGFLNLDTFVRALELPDSELVILLGEASFHQLHGGIATNANYRSFPETIGQWQAQYETIRGRPWSKPERKNRTFIGQLPPAALSHFTRSIVDPISTSPLGAAFDKALWLSTPSPRPSNPTVNALYELASGEFRAGRFEAAALIARMARDQSPDEPAPQRLLPNASRWLRDRGEPLGEKQAVFHLAIGKAHDLLGDSKSAAAQYRSALTFDNNLTEARRRLAELRFPGDGYMAWLARLHTVLRPKTYLEIGVEFGESLACALPPTQVIGVDPKPKTNVSFQTETQIFCETSNEFFARRRLEALFVGKPLDLVFIDGQHLFENALRDFMHSEAHCRRESIILLHNTVPIDEMTQRRRRETDFYTGDVWKTVLCLKNFRPDLAIFTIATAPTGLTIVTNLDPTSRVLFDHYDSIVAHFMPVPYSNIENHFDLELNVVRNDWSDTEARLKSLGVL